MAVGYMASAGQSSVAVGDGATNSFDGVSVGHGANSTNYGTAVGSYAAATGNASIAIGSSSSAATANSVALGSGSVADRGNAVSVGSTTTQRQIINVAAGTADTDTVNVSQLKGVTTALGGGASVNADGSVKAPSYAVQGTTKSDVGSALSALDTATTKNAGDITTLNTTVNNISNGTAGLVLQDATSKAITVAGKTAGTTVDFTGTAGTRQLKGVSKGTADTDAVNVAQLKAVGLSTDTSGNVTNAFVAYDSTTKDKVTLGGGAAGTTLTNVKAGALSASSTDAVNGSQLFATNTNVTKNTDNITALQTTVNNFSSGGAGLVQQDATTKTITVAANTAGTSIDFTGTAGPRKLAGVASGVADTDAVNMSQLSATNNRVTAGEAAITGLDGRVTQNESDVSKLNTNVTNLDGRVTTVESSVTNLTQQLNSGDVGLVQQDAATANITVAQSLAGATVDFTGTAGARVLTGVAAGTVGVSSKDAINGAQLYSMSTSVANAMGGGSTVNADGTVSSPSYVIDGQTVHNAGDAIANLNTQISNISTQISTGGLGLVQQNASNGFITVGASSAGQVVDFSGTQGTRVLTGVADGAVNDSSVDAVNGSQLFAMQDNLQQQIASIGTQMTMIDGRVTNVEINGASSGTASGDNSTASGQNSAATGDSSTATGANSTASGTDSTATGSNSTASGNNSTANGTNSTASGDNSSAMGGNSTASGNNSTAMGADSIASGDNSTAMGHHARATGDNSVSIGADSVADRDNSVSMGSAGQERQITNVAAGTQATDAVNVGQMNDALKSAVGNLPAGMSAKDYTDQQISTVQHSVNEVAKNAYAGVAAAMAMPNMTPSAPGKTVVAAGAGSYKSGAALGVGATYRSRNSKWLVNGAVSTTSTGDMGVRAQIGYEF